MEEARNFGAGFRLLKAACAASLLALAVYGAFEAGKAVQAELQGTAGQARVAAPAKVQARHTPELVQIDAPLESLWDEPAAQSCGKGACSLGAHAGIQEQEEPEGLAPGR